MQICLSAYVFGASVATDLVNTSARVRRRTGELLVDPPALAEFLVERDVRSGALGSDGQPTGNDLVQVLALRDDTRAVFEASSEARAVEGASALAARAPTSPRLELDADGRWQWHVATAPGASLADELAVLIGTGLLGVIRTLSLDRFRHCASPVCEGVFVDTSRAGRRRYCMPELCGNRINVTNHRARRRSGGAGGPGR